jgi:hypothetical protein
MSALSDSFASQIEAESWDSVGRMALNFQIGIPGNGRKTARLKKEMSLVKHIFHAHTKTEERKDRFVNAAFFVNFHKTLKKLERSFEDNGLPRPELMIFLEAVQLKLRKERLVVYKTLERRGEFERMKKV